MCTTLKTRCPGTGRGRGKHQTIKKTSEGEKKNNLKDFEQTDIFNNIKNSFPDAELIDVKDNKDD